MNHANMTKEELTVNNTHERMSFNDQDKGEYLNDLSIGQTMVCTADTCSISLNGSHNVSASVDEKTSQHNNKQSDGLPDPTIASEKKNKKNRRKNKGGSTQQSISSIQQIYTQNDLNLALQQHNTVLLEFVTSWCTACHGIQSLYEELALNEVENSEDNDGLLRATQVVCDRNKETKKLAEANGVGSYPVFVLYQQGTEVSKWKGADVGKLEKIFDSYGVCSGGKRGRGGKGKKAKGRK